MNSRKVTALTLKEKKDRGEKITMLTAYDYPTAQLLDEAGVDVILVGDSLGMVILGYPNTLSVTLEDMIHHGRAVVRGTKRAMVVIDLPFMTYQVNREQALYSTGRIIRETGADAVKLEGGMEIIEAVWGITGAGVPVVGHLGLTPQAVGQLGGFKVQGKDVESARKIIEDALALEEAGVCLLVLECVPSPLAAMITAKLSIPTIGIGAGAGCAGQALVYHDMIGLSTGRLPRFVKQYTAARREALAAVQAYIREVKEGIFPAGEHGYDIPASVLEQLSLS